MTPSVIFITLVFFSHNLINFLSSLSVSAVFLAWHCTQIFGTAVPLSVRMAGLRNYVQSFLPEDTYTVLSRPVWLCSMSMWDGPGRAWISLFLRRRSYCATIPQEAELLQLVWPHPSENILQKKSSLSSEKNLSQIYVLPWRICVTLTYHSPSCRNMSKMGGGCFLSHGNALSEASAFCVYQQPGAGLFHTPKTGVAAVTQGRMRLQSTHSCSKSRASPQLGD